MTLGDDDQQAETVECKFCRIDYERKRVTFSKVLRANICVFCQSQLIKEFRRGIELSDLSVTDLVNMLATVKDIEDRHNPAVTIAVLSKLEHAILSELSQRLKKLGNELEMEYRGSL